MAKDTAELAAVVAQTVKTRDQWVSIVGRAIQDLQRIAGRPEFVGIEAGGLAIVTNHGNPTVHLTVGGESNLDNVTYANAASWLGALQGFRDELLDKCAKEALKLLQHEERMLERANTL